MRVVKVFVDQGCVQDVIVPADMQVMIYDYDIENV